MNETEKMAFKFPSSKPFSSSSSTILVRQLKNQTKGFHRGKSNTNNNIHASATQCKYQKYPSLANRPDLSHTTVIFNVEEALLKTSSVFPYFMLVAFEAGSILRAFVLLLLYPLVCFLGEETRLKVMVFLCFVGIKEESFRVGRAVLPKLLSEHVGFEAFEVVQRAGRKVAVSNLPRVMVESFLRDHLDIDLVVGREVRLFCGFFMGLMDDRRICTVSMEKMIGMGILGSRDVVGIAGFNKSLHHHLFSRCKEIYLVRKSDKGRWREVSRGEFLRPLIFHDGRLAFNPTPSATLAMFMWVPFGFVLAIIRAVVTLSLPRQTSVPILAYAGLHFTVTFSPKSLTKSSKSKTNDKGVLYVCNHRTLLDPLYLSVALQKNLTAVTYSLSRMSEMISPIRTVRLTRDLERDRRMMEMLLDQGDLVVCPEGTTCREPYLLRFSPLFSETTDDIVPVAIDTHVGMFHGTTAAGFKCLDPLFFVMNATPVYTIQMLDGGPVPGASRFEAANHVQSEIGKALGFRCTKLTRKDKYLILAGNEGKA